MYNPSDVGKKGTLFGLPYTQEEADLIIVPVPLDITVSYGGGTSNAPDQVLEESTQLDLSLPFVDKPWLLKMAMTHQVLEKENNDQLRKRAIAIINHLENGGDKETFREDFEEINAYCENLVQKVEHVCGHWIEKGKMVGLLGGDHSSPLGLIRSLARHHEFGILQIDAHMDLRKAYEGFTYSHASVFHNALKEEGVSSLTQVGIRDYCEEEESYIAKSPKGIHTFYDEAIQKLKWVGKSWIKQVDAIIQTLPEKVYISFDIDGLDPSLCPNTGTPVPGGLQFHDAMYLAEHVIRSNRKVIGFDVCEVGNNAWDANVGARVLYRMAVTMGLSNGNLRFK